MFSDHLCCSTVFHSVMSTHSASGIAVQSPGKSSEIDWKSYEKEVDPQVLKLFKDSFACKQFQHPSWLQVARLPLARL